MGSSDDDEEDDGLAIAPSQNRRNYITPAGYAALQTELLQLIDTERPRVVEIVSWAASNGDRSENGDYLYGKKRLREIDRRIRYLSRRLEVAVIADPSLHHGSEQIFFGATVTYAYTHGLEHTVTIKGIDETDNLKGEVSWISPIAQALLKAHVGDEVRIQTPKGQDWVEVLDVQYPEPAALSHP